MKNKKNKKKNTQVQKSKISKGEKQKKKKRLTEAQFIKHRFLILVPPPRYNFPAL
jgi:hypothetical protein